jgi:cyclophilin family peptidyl-prolyl cis-trans isomerase
MIRIATSVLLLAVAVSAQTSSSGSSSTTQSTTTTKKTTTTHRSTTHRRAATKPKAKATPDPDKFAEPVAHIETSAGTFNCKLFPKQAPKTVHNFIGLSTGKIDWTDPKTGQMEHGKPLYNGTIFHRVMPNFMIQGGDPTGTGMGGPGYQFEDEFDPSLQFDKPGLLAMANAGPGTNGSQFFITEQPTPWLNNHHTIFGECDEPSVELEKKVARAPVGASNRPDDPVKITQITFTDAAAPAKPAATTPAKRTTTTTHKPGSTTKKPAPKPSSSSTSPQ